MTGTSELYEDAGGQFRFRSKAAHGQTIAASEGPASRAAAKNGIESVRTNASDAALVDLTE